jgi:hypothetical protein
LPFWHNKKDISDKNKIKWYVCSKFIPDNRVQLRRTQKNVKIQNFLANFGSIMTKWTSFKFEPCINKIIKTQETAVEKELDSLHGDVMRISQTDLI